MTVESKPLPPFNAIHLREYYGTHFPFKTMAKWLGYGSSMMKREMSVTLANDVYIRYLSFAGAPEFQKEVVKGPQELQSLPYKIDIGAIYNAPPKDRAAYPKFFPVERELVFDIDMTDYDDVRTCCSDATVCDKCWRFLSVAAKVLDIGLREDFGFQHIAWVYSGRRGIHGWICDARARKMTDARSAVAEYFNILTGGGKEGTVKVDFKAADGALHPSLMRARTILEEDIVTILEEQQLLSKTSEDGMGPNYKKVTKFISKQDVREYVEEKLEDAAHKADAATRWRIVQDCLKKERTSLDQLLFGIAYPRLDINVTRGMNHLLKAPFCAHPKTGSVCIPISSADIASFRPSHAPHISMLVSRDEDALARLQKSTEFFTTFVDNVVQEAKSETRKRGREETLDY